MNDVKKIGIIGAMQVEVDGINALLENKKTEVVSGIAFTEGTLAGRQVVTAVCGVGKVFAATAAEAMILRYGVSALLNTGVAGGLDPSLTVGDAVVADRVVQHDMNTTAIGDPRGLLSGVGKIFLPTDETLTRALADATAACGIRTLVGTVASGDLFVAKDSTKRAIVSEFGAVACEMEGAAIGTVAYVNGVPFAVLRAISDGGDGMEFSKFVTLAAANSVRVTTEFVRNV